MSAVNLIAVFAENQLGQMARITRVLADADVNIRWVTIATNESLGVIKFLVDKCDRAHQRLQEKGWTVSLVEVLAIEVDGPARRAPRRRRLPGPQPDQCRKLFRVRLP